MQKKQISHYPISPYFWYVIFECLSETKNEKNKKEKKQQQKKKKNKKKKKKKTLVLQFVLG